MTASLNSKLSIDFHRAMSSSSKSTEVQHVDFPDEMIPASTGKSAVNLALMLACVVFGAASFLFGFDDKIISPVAALEPFVDRYQGLNPKTGVYSMTARNQTIIFSVPLVGSIFGGLAASPLNFRLGRKPPVLIAYVISVGGGLLQLFAPNLAAFVSGRFLNAIAMGIANGTVPLYLSEIVPSSMRGRSVSMINILNVMAGLIGTIVVFVTQKLGGRESYMIPLAVQTAVPGVLFICTLPVSESPQWLVARGRMEQARTSLQKLRGFDAQAVEEELGIIQLSEQTERELRASGNFWEIFTRQHLRRTITAGSFYSLNQISGVILSTTYSTVFLAEMGTKDPFSLTVIASCCTLAGAIAAPLVIDRRGRRPTALVGMSALFIIDAVAGSLAFSRGDAQSIQAIAALSFIFNFFWASSFASLSNLMPSEIATPKLRHHTMAYTIACAQITAVITTLVVPQLTTADAAGLGARAYLIFAGCMACILVFTYFFMPETKDRTFAEINEMYEAKVPARKWRQYQTSERARTGKCFPHGQTVVSSSKSGS
ncbi:uncharacterized protein LDX57_008911 [Aspergillus melleus]|uniref:uncharacterized protein n=1 Tax=Aspergillus melleus TaxID=138277 RepID=UPI001E8CB6F1|nr:uncharacterized protein LDX57_008911 [Aspergillus melleus]KAH8431249.1 hypothetical protein LDX57_008911 [Aspergillus melleus]